MSNVTETERITNTSNNPTTPTPAAGGPAVNPAYQAQEDFQRASVRLRSQLAGLAGSASTDDLREELTDAIREVAEKLGEVECAVNEIAANSLTAWVRGQLNAPPAPEVEAEAGPEADNAKNPEKTKAKRLPPLHRHVPEDATVADAYASELTGLRLRIPGTPLHLSGGIIDNATDDWRAEAGMLLYVMMTPAQAKVLGIAIEHDQHGEAKDLAEAGFHLPRLTTKGGAQ